MNEQIRHPIEQPDPSLFEMRIRAERAERERDQLRKEVEGLHDRMAMLREEVARRDEQVRKHVGELRELRREAGDV